jgi:pyruvate,water dikinase
MSCASQFIQPLCDCRDTSLVGGKAANLGSLLRADFPVPDGFVVTTRACQWARGRPPAGTSSGGLHADVADEIRLAYRALGGGRVAVRSSATSEDGAAASMAGQYETFLGVEGESNVLDALRRCWASLDAPRALAYLRQHGLDPASAAMAVVVQRLVSADVSGVLFTTNPHDGHQLEMLVEAGWGLGDAVVSGSVQPDTLRIDRETGRVLAVALGDRRFPAAVRSDQPDDGPEGRPCLSGCDVYRLWQLGKQAAEHFGSPQDVEWAIQAGKVYVLQSRPITTLEGLESRHRVLQAARERLRQQSAAARGPWVLHNLAETLPHPTPLTWSLIGRFMSGRGGLGAMYRRAGFAPSAIADREGFLELIAGRVYMDAARAPEMFFEGFPFAYSMDDLNRSPDASQTPPTLPHGSLTSRLTARRRLAAAQATLRALAQNFDRQLRETIFPAFVRYVADEKQVDLRALSAQRLIACWQSREERVLDQFGGQSLLPGLIGEMAVGELCALLAEHFWNEDPDALAHLVSSGGPSDRTVVRDAELYEVGKGDRSLETWLGEHGHRAADELELAAARWREPSETEIVRGTAARLAAGENPIERQRRHAAAVHQQVAGLRQRLPGRDCRKFDRLVDLVQRYIPFREDGKDLLILGYDLLRDLALEVGRRLGLGPDVFFLTREELFDALRVGIAPFHLIRQRTAAYRAESRLEVPRLIDPKAVDTLGDEPPAGAVPGSHKGFAVSSGKASGPVKILASPRDAGDLGRGCVLVCPSTDPSWTPLFAGAAGLVLERGGMLSHGAVVARELGLPAVVLPQATRFFRDGEEICVDGRWGWVGKSSPACPPELSAGAADPDDTSVSHELVPPPPGRKDRAAAKLGNALAVVWAAFLLSAFLLPARWVYQPTMAALDFILWPLVRTAGKPGAVAAIAVCLAALSLTVQKLVNDNRRLREAKRRATALQALARSVPEDSPRHRALGGFVATVQLRGFLAAMVPVGILLGPMVAPFVWLRQRVDPSVANAPPGSSVHVVAMVDSDWSSPVRLDVPPPIIVDEATPPSCTPPPIRKTLERLLMLYRQPRTIPNEPWEMQVAPDLARQQAADDLTAYLAAGVLPQAITWLVQPPAEFNGQFDVTVTAVGTPPVTARVVLGDRHPPAGDITRGPAGAPVRELRVVYPKTRTEAVFWRPLAGLAAGHGHSVLAWLGRIDIGWLWLYVLAYLSALMLGRVILKVA